MASAKLMIPKRSAPYYVLTANVTVHGKRVRRYGRFDFDPTVLKPTASVKTLPLKPHSFLNAQSSRKPTMKKMAKTRLFEM